MKRADGTIKLPLVYRIDIDQGNTIKQSMIDKLEAGMNKEKVNFIMGTPLLVDPFHSNRWDYIHSIEPNSGERSQRRITLYFKDDKLSHITGDTVTAERVAGTEEQDRVLNVEISGNQKKLGLFERLLDFARSAKGADEDRSDRSSVLGGTQQPPNEPVDPENGDSPGDVGQDG